jgi:hypothetical protein
MLGLADRRGLVPIAGYEEEELLKEVGIISACLDNNSVSEVMSWPSSWRKIMWEQYLERIKK